MKTQYYASSSLDGFIATEDDSLEWLFPLANLDDAGFASFIADVGALAMGSATYEWMMRHSDRMIAETGSPWPYQQPTWVFSSRTLPKLAGADIRFAHGDVHDAFTEMRREAGEKNIWIVGGGELAAQFYDAGIMDELIVQIGSVTLRQGKPLLPRRVLSPRLGLQTARLIGPGMAELRYDVCY
jgi:dihydrofolate reductase